MTTIGGATVPIVNSGSSSTFGGAPLAGPPVSAWNGYVYPLSAVPAIP